METILVPVSSDIASFYTNFAGENINNDVPTWPSPSGGSTMSAASPSNTSTSAGSTGAQSPYSDFYDDDDNDAEVFGEPYLEIVEQPVGSFRFRYRSEMQGAHGSLLGRGEGSRKKCYPTVKLHNYDGDAIIRCSLYTAAEKDPIPHMHQLVSKVNNKDVFDHEMVVSERNGYRAEFKGLGIVHVSKKFLKDELIRKKELKLLEDLRSDPAFMNRAESELQRAVELEKSKIVASAEREAKVMDANKLKLCFEAFIRHESGRVIPLCDKVYSETIQNMKSAETGELKICRMDRYMGSCRGGDEVFILVEKVCKKNIQVRFYEEDQNGKEVWNDLASFQEYDVHHQYAIVFRTPPYRSLEIEENVKVKVQLFRPKNKQYSEPIEFEYKPVNRRQRKRPHPSESFSSDSFSSIEAAKKYRMPNPDAAKKAMLSDQDPLISSGSSLNSLRFPSDLVQEAINIVTSEAGAGDSEIRGFEKFVFSDAFLNEYLPEDVGSTQDASLLLNSEGRLLSEDTAETFLQLTEIIPEAMDTGTDGAKRNIKVTALRVAPEPSAAHPSSASSTFNSNSVVIDGGIQKTKAPSPKASETIQKPKETVVSPKNVLRSPGKNVHKMPEQLKNVTDDYEEEVERVTKTTLKELQRLMKITQPNRVALIRAFLTKGIGLLQSAVVHGQVKELGDILSILIMGSSGRENRRILTVLNSLNCHKETPLMVAVRENKVDCMKLLLMAGAEPSTTDNKDNNAYHLAVKYRSHNAMKALCKDVKDSGRKRTGLEKMNEEGETPLLLAVRMNDKVSAMSLIEAGADANAKVPKSGLSALHLAVECGSKEIVTILLELDHIRVNEETLGGQTPLDLAENSGKKDIAQLIRKVLSSEKDCTVKLKDIKIGGEVERGEGSDEDEDDDGLQIDEEDKSSDDETSDNDYYDADGLDEKLELGDNSSQRNLNKRDMEDIDANGDENCGSPDSNSSNEDQSDFLDSKTLRIVAENLDKEEKWKKLCHKLNCDFLIANIANVKSPTRCLIAYIDCEKEISCQWFRDAVAELDCPDAVSAIDHMLKL